MGLNKVQSVAGNFVNCGPVHSLKQILGKYPEKKEKKKTSSSFSRRVDLPGKEGNICLSQQVHEVIVIPTKTD